MIGVRLYLAQRISAAVLAPLVLGHLLLIIYAVRGGLDAAEILQRTQGSFVWGLFYGVFVLAVSIHAAIGLRVIVHEYLKLSETALNVFSWLVGLMWFALGARAIVAVVL